MPKFLFSRNLILSAAVLIAAGIFSGCSSVPAEGAEDPYAVPLPAEEEVVWVTDNTAHLYGVPDAVPVPAGSIAIGSAEELASIGREKGYPLDGDYVLITDLDLTGVEMEPIGGSASNCGNVAGDNVFSGTFDGRGHTIRGLTMEFHESVRVHVGLFGSVGSDNPADPAEIRNLILKEVSLSGDFSDVYTMGALAGQVSGYAQIDDIAVLSGSVAANSGDGSLGVGGLIGQIRTNTDTGCSNEGVSVTDIYCSLQVSAFKSDVTSGLIGRIRASDLGELSRVIVTGQARVKGDKGRAICGGDGVPLVSENVWYLSSAGTAYADIGQSKSSSSLKELPGKGWKSADGLYAMPEMVWDSAVFSPGLDSLFLQVSPGDTVDHVEYNFTLPQKSGGQPIVWTSDDPEHLRIEGSNAIVQKPEYGSVYVRLTASAGEVSRTYTLRVVSGKEVSLDRDGSWLIAEGYPPDTDYCWVTENITDGTVTDFQWNRTGRFLTTGLPENSRVELRVAGYEPLRWVPSSVAALYIDCSTGYYSLTKAAAQSAKIQLVTAEGKTEYSGGGSIKLRGNSSAHQEKRPFKLKLDTKADLFGMGKNKHWVLLANWYDRTHLRGVMSYEMSGRLGMWYCESVWVELYYNGEYCGLYQLCESIRVDEERVDIFDWEEAAEAVASLCAEDYGLSQRKEEALARQLAYDLSWVTKGTNGTYDLSDYIDALDLTIDGGYLIENDSYNDEPSRFTTENGVMYMVTAPNTLAESRDMFRWVQNYFQSVEDAIFSPTRRNGNGDHYADLMDMDSFADYWFVNEFFKNGEILFKSTFLSLDRGGKLTWGPVWDMDWAGGNHVNLGEGGQNPAGWVHGGGERQVWSRSLFTDPYCVLLLYERFDDTVRSAMDAALADLEIYAAGLQTAADLDNGRWKYPDTFAEEIDLYRTWLTGRREWMTAQFASPETLLKSLKMYTPSEVMTVTGGTFTGNTLTLTMALSDGAADFAEVFVNGVSCGTVPLTEVITVPVPERAGETTAAYDAVEVLGCRAEGDYRIVQQRGGTDGCDIRESGCIFIPKH